MQNRWTRYKRQAFVDILLGTKRTAGQDSPDPETPQRREALGSTEGGARSGSSLLYLNSNISTDTHKTPPQDQAEKLSPYHQKSAFTLSRNVDRFCELYGIENCAFLTLTFPDNVKCHKEASRRFNSMNTHFLSAFYGEWIWDRERQKRGAWHYHIIIQCKGDIRTGFDWEEYRSWIADYSNGKRRRLKTGSPLLRSLWDLNSRAFPKYGFGRVELLPIRSTSEAVAKYVGKYIAKQIGQRPEEDKGVRLTGHSRGFVACSPNFSWNTEGGKLWRKNLALFVQLSCQCRDYEEFSARAGPKWAYKYRKQIIEYQEYMKERYPDEPPF